MRLHILTFIPLAELARLASTGKALRALYREQLKERQTRIDAALAAGWPKEVTDGLSEADKAVPRDLVVFPPVSYLVANLDCYFNS
jgi:hypothetical protein